MTTGKTGRAMLRVAFVATALAAAALGVGGCDWFDDPVDVNLPPDTVMESCPGDRDVVTGDDVTIEWSGVDDDGSVVDYEWTLDDTLAGETDETSYTILDVSQGDHVFEVAAVDDDGENDESPAVCSFTASEQQGPVERVVLVELLTTKICTNCPNAEEALDALLDAYGRDYLCVVAYHDIVGPDPVATAETTERTDWYTDDPNHDAQAGSWPTAIFDGGRIVFGAASPELAEAEYAFEITLREQALSPIRLDVTGSVSEGDVSVSVTVQETLPGGTNTLRIVVIEDGIIDGSDHFDFVARDILDDVTLEISTAGESVLIERSFDVDAGWNTANLDIVAFVQNDSTKEVLQSARLVSR